MDRRPRPSLVVLASIIALVSGCTVASEEKILKDFFRASRLRDYPTLGTFATASFDPRKDGQVQSFKVVEIAEEQRTPVPIRDYVQAVDAAKQAEQTFSKEKMAYQNANIRAIERVIQAERRQKPISRQDLLVQGAWTKWRADAAQHAKAVSDARLKLRSLQGLVELSLSQPNGPTPDISKLDGHLVDKDITINADVRTPDGQKAQKTLVVTLTRAVMREGNKDPEKGRWIVRRVRTAGAQPTT
jgi:hypothetical protein